MSGVGVLQGLGQLGDFGADELDALLFQVLLDAIKAGGVAGDLEVGAVEFHVLGAGFERLGHEGILGRRGGIDEHGAFALEEEADAARPAHVAAVALEDLADFAVGPVAVIRKHVDHDGDAAGAIAFVTDFLEGDALRLAGAAFDGPVDVVLGHGDFAGLVDGVAKFEVHVGIAAAVARRHDDGPA